MRKSMGKLGDAIVRPFLRAVPLFLLLFAALFLALPETANAQVWVTSSLTPSPDGTQLTASCSTSAAYSNVGTLSPWDTSEASEYYPAGIQVGDPTWWAYWYQSFTASCAVTTSTGQTIAFPGCPAGPLENNPQALTYGVTGNPTGQCSTTIQTQPGVNYTINSQHYIVLAPIGWTALGFPESAACISVTGVYDGPDGTVTLPVPPAPPWAQTGPALLGYYDPGGLGTYLLTPSFSNGSYMFLPLNFFGNWGLLTTELNGSCISNFYSSGYVPVATTVASYQAPCPTPTVASITPSTWWAGQTSNNVTITGTNFITTAAATANPSCPASTVDLTTPSGAAVALGAVTVNSPTQITIATVTPPAKETTEGATLSVSGDFNQQPNADILGNPQIQCAGATMQCNGETISVLTGDAPIQDVVVGQQVVLDTTPTAAQLTALPLPLTLGTTTWTAKGTNIGGYTASTAGASVTPTTLTGPSLTTYWVYAGTDIPVTYEYCVGSQCSSKANAAFTVNGPTGSATATVTGVSVSPKVPICNGTTATEQLLVFGTGVGSGKCSSGNTGGIAITGNYGITLGGKAANVPSSGGTLEWIQLIAVNLETETPAGGGTPTSLDCGEGLDNKLPYPSTTTNGILTASDIPAQGLSAPYIGASRTFTASTYLMWQSKLTGSNLVPLGYVSWNWSGAAAENTATQTWSLSPGATWTAKPSFVKSSDNNPDTRGYPTWTSLVINGVCTTVTTNAEEEQ